MPAREPSPGPQIVPATTQALAVHSAAIVTRGLRDLARESNWLVKKVFSGHAASLAISPAGQLCAVTRGPRQNAERLVVYDIELGVPTLALAVPGDSGARAPGQPAAFAWSPTGGSLVAAWGAWAPSLYAFDLQGKSLLGSFGGFSKIPSSLAWSGEGKYFAAASAGGEGARLRMWNATSGSPGALPFGPEPAAELEISACSAWSVWSAQVDSAEDPLGGSEDGDLPAGFGRAAFSPDEATLAAVIEVEGEWADDAVAWLDAARLTHRGVCRVPGRVTDLAWAAAGGALIVCSGGQASRLLLDSPEPQPLPFGAELCACHPDLPVCMCYSSWLKNSAKGRLFLVDLERLRVFDEYPAEGIADLRWSGDGSKAWAVTSEGLACIYEPPIL